MSKKKRITPEEHKRHIEAYRAVVHEYQLYATVMARVLQAACDAALPEAHVQSRAKSVSSFAEKFARKFEKYPDPVNDMTDLCGARVIVQTLEQVQAVRQFIEANFEILETDDKGLSLSEDEFGYRDMHYIIRLRPDRDLGIAPQERATIGKKRAEVQVRTWVQHAWADTLHDRMYKAKLKYPTEFRRTGALLAALMEDGDRAFDRLALEIDGLLANYSSYASKGDVDDEIAVRELLLANEPKPAKKPLIALALARLLVARGDYPRAVEALEPFAQPGGSEQDEILLELGYALCKVNRRAPESVPYRRGQTHIEKVVEGCTVGDLDSVPNLRKRKGLRARALARLAWTWDAVPGKEGLARSLYAMALETEPDNPYYLADVLGYEVHCSGNADFIPSMAAALREGIRICSEHALNGTEMPYACLTAGRLHLLLGEGYRALGAYARGIRHILAGTHCLPPDVLDLEAEWIVRVVGTGILKDGYLWAKTFLELAGRAARAGGREETAQPVPLRPPVLIASGGAITFEGKVADRLYPMLAGALEEFSGTVVSGGTAVGLPGLIGKVAADLSARHAKRFRLVAYIPKRLPEDAPRDARYDSPPIVCGDRFSPEQVMRNWQDILDSGIDPKDVSLLGAGGGPISAVEYGVALAFGATVAVLRGSGRAADMLADDPLWQGVPNLLVMPFDAASVRAFIVRPESGLGPVILEQMGREFHADYVDHNQRRLPENMRPWKELADTFRRANCEQARYATAILRAAGFAVVPSDNPVVFTGFTDAEVEHMAELEHGRWNVERLRDGWRPGRPRDNERKIHDCLIPWSDLPDWIREFDRNSMRKLPEILAKAKLEVRRQ